MSRRMNEAPNFGMKMALNHEKTSGSRSLFHNFHPHSLLEQPEL